MDIIISVKSYEQLNQFRKVYYKNTGTWLEDYNAIITKMMELAEFLLWQKLKKLKTTSL